MKLDLELDELALICEAMVVYRSGADLTERLAATLYFEQEVADLNFDEDDGCAGGACKL